MVITTPLPCVKAFGDELNNILEKDRGGQGLSRRQRGGLAFCLTGILVTHSVCWAKFERARLGTYSLAALSWIVRNAKIPWAYLLQTRVTVVLRQSAITQGWLVVEDSDKKRCQVTKRIFTAHQLQAKTRGGYINGQTLVLWLRVTPQVTRPVGFALYLPDPTLTAGKKADEKLKKQGVPPKNRPAKPARNPAYPTKQEMALHLLAEFRREHRTMEVQMVLAEALYATNPGMEQATTLFGTQGISQRHKNQHVRFRHKLSSSEKYVTQSPGVLPQIRIRGDEAVRVMVRRARLSVDAHPQKRLVIALTYAQETDSRYIVASDLSWRP